MDWILRYIKTYLFYGYNIIFGDKPSVCSHFKPLRQSRTNVTIINIVNSRIFTSAFRCHVLYNLDYLIVCITISNYFSFNSHLHSLAVSSKCQLIMLM